MSQTPPSNQEQTKQAQSDKPTPQSPAPAAANAAGNGPVNPHQPRVLDDFALRSRRMAEACEDIADHCNQFAKSLRKASQDFAQDILDMLGKIK